MSARRRSRAALASPLVALCAALAPAQAPTPLGPARVQEPVECVSVILIPFADVSRSPKALPRDEAVAAAKALVRRLKQGASFDELARESSGDSSAAVGGYLGQLPRSMLRRELATALADAPHAQLLGPIESPLGVHLVQRHEIAVRWPERLASAHVLIGYADALEPQGKARNRSRDQARIEAQKVYAELKAGKLDFDEAARRYSDDARTAAKGGRLGTLPPQRLLATYVDAVVRLEPGGISPPFETPFGFHVAQRLAVATPYHASHILVPWKGCTGAAAGVTCSRDEALAEARKLMEGIKGLDGFAAAARRYSSCPSATRGGDLGEFGEGRMVEAFEKAVAGAEPGTMVGPVETRYGWHLIWRHR
ncbi:MAG: peptidylprolyl isomerase [Planctomycetota bacterium]